MACWQPTVHTCACACRNYVKFLVDRDGKPVRRYTSTFDPIKAEDDVSSHDPSSLWRLLPPCENYRTSNEKAAGLQIQMIAPMSCQSCIHPLACLAT